MNFVTTSVDVQIDHFVITAWGWDRQQRGHLIAYGTVPSWTQVKQWCLTSYAHADGGPPIQSFVNLVDSRDGNRKDEIVDFCKAVNRSSGPFVWPSMGARPGSMNLQLFKKLNIDADRNVGRKALRNVIEGMYVVMVNTTFTQEWLDNALARRRPGDPMSLILPQSDGRRPRLLRTTIERTLRSRKGNLDPDRRDNGPSRFPRLRPLRPRGGRDLLQRQLDTNSRSPDRCRSRRNNNGKQQQTKATTKTTKRTGFVRKSGKRFVRRRNDR